MDLNKNIKIFFIDLDGTFLDTHKDGAHWMSDENLNAVKEMRKKGVEVVISTGRQGLQSKRYLDHIEHDYAVTGNGSIVLKQGKIVKEVLMTLRQSLLITDFAKKHGLSMKLDDSRIGYGTFKASARYFTSKMGFTPVPHFNFEMHKQYHKIVLWGKSKSKMDKLRKLLVEEVADVSMVTSANGWTLEVSHKDATKGTGNLFVAQQLGITEKKHMAHIGDSMNDSTVVGHMRLIAMKNSDKKLLRLTRFVGPSYKRAGVAKILRGEYKKLEK